MNLNTAKILVLILFCFFAKVNAQTLYPINSSFYNFLLNKYPETVDDKGNLVIEKANSADIQIFDCRQKGLESIDGVQFFTGIINLQASENKLVALPDLDNLKNLEVLHVSDNQLKDIPKLDDLVALKQLIVYNNKLEQLPSLEKNSNLTHIIAYTNQIKIFPSLQNLPNLIGIDVSYNLIDLIPPIQNLPKLYSLSASGNNITSVGSFEGLPILSTINLSNNKLTSLPTVASLTNLEILNLDNNQLTGLPDLSSNTNLTSLTVSSNNLTFEDLLPLTKLPGFGEEYIFSPQNNILIESQNTSLNLPEVKLFANINETTGNSYEWYKNDSLLLVTNTPFIIIHKSFFNNNSLVHLKVKNSSNGLGSLILESNKLNITINDCANLNGLTYRITAFECVNGSSLIIDESSVKGGTGPFRYQLEAIGTGQKKESSDGAFKTLLDLAYRLTVTSKNGCTSEYHKPIFQTSGDCNQFILTPDNDGDHDSYYFEEHGIAEVYDSKGRMVHKLNIPLEWKGEDKSGTITSGYYSVKINDKKIIHFTVFY